MFFSKTKVCFFKNIRVFLGTHRHPLSEERRVNFTAVLDCEKCKVQKVQGAESACTNNERSTELSLRGYE